MLAAFAVPSPKSDGAQALREVLPALRDPRLANGMWLSAQDQKLNHGIAFALTNLTWAAGQAIAASASGALADATSDVFPYLLLGAACLATLFGMLRTRPSALPDFSSEAD